MQQMRKNDKIVFMFGICLFIEVFKGLIIFEMGVYILFKLNGYE